MYFWSVIAVLYVILNYIGVQKDKRQWVIVNWLKRKYPGKSVGQLGSSGRSFGIITLQIADRHYKEATPEERKDIDALRRWVRIVVFAGIAGLCAIVAASAMQRK
jgi:hypothetical protein